MSILIETIELEQNTPQNEILRIKLETKRMFEQLQSVLERETVRFWENEHGFTPTQMAEALGTDAVELFTIHQQCCALLEQALPGSATEITSKVQPYNINGDGSITVL